MLNMMRLHGAWFKQKLGMWIWIFFLLLFVLVFYLDFSLRMIEFKGNSN